MIKPVDELELGVGVGVEVEIVEDVVEKVEVEDDVEDDDNDDFDVEIVDELIVVVVKKGQAEKVFVKSFSFINSIICV
jgi:hypothetical protein